MRKKYFYLLIKTERKKWITDKRFPKETFTSSQRDCCNPLHRRRNTVCAQTLWKFPEINQNFDSPKTFCFYKIEESVNGNSDKPAHKIYKEAVTEGHSVTGKSRNICQVHCIREKARTEE